jgi:hypothetical protein
MLTHAETRSPEGTSRSLALDVALAVVVGLVAALAKRYLDWRLGIPGHGGVGWIASLVAGTAVVRRPGGSVIAGAAMAVWGAPLGLNHTLAYNLGVYTLAGAVIDGSRAIGVRLDRLPGALTVGAATHVAKYGYVLAVAWASGIVRRVEVYGLLAALRNHILFGAAGGLVAVAGVVAVRRVRRARQ